MGIKAGLVGLPNVGKSTLFNALTKSSIPAENYPFCTIDPNNAITKVPDNNFEKIIKIYNPKKQVFATVSFVDIAGLVKGASKGEGLGNQFLGHIREVNLIIHVLRCFDDKNITSQNKKIDPIEDFETVVSELMLKDLESIEKRLLKIETLKKAAQHNNQQELAKLNSEEIFLHEIIKLLDNGNAQAIYQLMHNTKITELPLLSSKNILIVANISEHELENNSYEKNQYYKSLIDKFGKEKVVAISAKTEYELSQMSDDDKNEMMNIIGMKNSNLENIIKKAYKNLGFITFFTAGPKEVHAWPIEKETKIRQAAGEIHSDMEKGFICSEVFNCKDLFEYKTETKLKDLGKIRTEGQDYIVQDGDIIFIRFNV